MQKYTQNKEQAAIQEYQCIGCLNGPYPKCFVKSSAGVGCKKQFAGSTKAMTTNEGTLMRRIFLSLPNGFCNLGEQKDMRIFIFKNLKQQQEQWNYDMYNIPVWKHKMEDGNLLVRGYMPRLNMGFIHIILDGNLDDINAIEITEEKMKEMD